jgi:hypothetical protein
MALVSLLGETIQGKNGDVKVADLEDPNVGTVVGMFLLHSCETRIRDRVPLRPMILQIL